jgi:hypothetical protein
VERFYLRIEDTPELQTLLATPRWAGCVTSTFAFGTLWAWTELASRQAEHVSTAVRQAKKDGVTHLLHLDDDELLYLPRGQPAFHRALRQCSAAVSVHIRNIEVRRRRVRGMPVRRLTVTAWLTPGRAPPPVQALVPSPRCTNPFAEAVAFRHQPWTYGSYGYPPCSGKSIGCLRVEAIAPNGPHHFGVAGSAATGMPLDGGRSAVLPHGAAVILHYESSTYERWRQKFTQLAANAPAKGRAFSPFYHDSVGCCAEINEARALCRGSSTPGAREAYAAAERKARAVWCRWRVAPPQVAPASAPPPSRAAAHPQAEAPPVWRVLRQRGLTVLSAPPAATAAVHAADAAATRSEAHREAAAIDARRYSYWSALASCSWHVSAQINKRLPHGNS